MERFSNLLGFEIKKSSVSTWKMKYLAEVRNIKRVTRAVETGQNLHDGL